jgi:hypothetical protein
MRFQFSVVILVALSTSAAIAEKGAHRAMRPKRLVGVGTCLNQHVIGNYVFSMKELSPRDTKPSGLITKLEFKSGEPPREWFGRPYFPCTQGEAVAGISGDSRGHKLRTRISWGEGRDEDGFSIVSQITAENKGWNTVLFEGADLNRKLAQLAPGTYKLSFVEQIEYEVPVDGQWEGRFMILADGVLEAIVR